MRVTPVKTRIVRAGELSLEELVDESLQTIAEGSIVVVTSKIVSLCEDQTAPADADREQLIRQEAELYLDPKESKYGHHFTIADNTLVASSGIDASNTGGPYVLWPQNAQESANRLREHLVRTRGLRRIGVIITDSTSQPLRRGSIGIALAHSGFQAMNSYAGQVDLFGRVLEYANANIASGLATAAVVTMGEGSEGTPLCVVQDTERVVFVDRNPSREELDDLRPTLENDLFEPFFRSAPWRRGGRYSD